jgi:hypothetical protein
MRIAESNRHGFLVACTAMTLTVKGLLNSNHRRQIYLSAAPIP